jgi:hypothetical protein
MMRLQRNRENGCDNVHANGDRNRGVGGGGEEEGELTGTGE